MRLVCCLVLLLGGLQLASALLVAAWNIQKFGESKTNLKNPDSTKAAILKYIATVVRRYDVILIQEVIDSNKKANPVANALKTAVNNLGGDQYDFTVSDPLGSGNYKERYLFIYKTSSVTFVDSHQSPTPPPKVVSSTPNPKVVSSTPNPKVVSSTPNPQVVFSRSPFAVKFEVKAVAGKKPFDFVMIPLHAEPKSGKTVAEINALDAVVQDVKAKWNTQNILLLGDFNAGRKYLPKKHQQKLTLTPPDYHWLIGDDADTSLGNGKYAYDRIVATTAMLKHVGQKTAGQKSPAVATGAMLNTGAKRQTPATGAMLNPFAKRQTPATGAMLNPFAKRQTPATGAMLNPGAKRPAVAPNYNAEVFDFVKAGNLPHGVQAKEVSDHRVVQVELRAA